MIFQAVLLFFARVGTDINSRRMKEWNLTILLGCIIKGELNTLNTTYPISLSIQYQMVRKYSKCWMPIVWIYYIIRRVFIWVLTLFLQHIITFIFYSLNRNITCVFMDMCIPVDNKNETTIAYFVLFREK